MRFWVLTSPSGATRARRQSGAAQERRIEPLARLCGIDRREIVVARRQSADLEPAVLIGPGGHDVPRLRPPERGIVREGEHRVIR